MSAIIGEPDYVPPPPRRVYVSGPMTGYFDLNRSAFIFASDRLTTWGFEPVNPAEVVLDLPHVPTWEDYLRHDLGLLLACDGVATLPGWQESRGASLEVYVAQQLGLTVKPVDRWEP